MLAFARPALPPRTTNAHNNTVIWENGRSKLEFHPPSAKSDKHIMTFTMPPYSKDNPSIVQPPFHWHIYQTEIFHILSGTANFYFGLASEPYRVLSTTIPKAPTRIVLPPGRYHRFENASETENLVINVEFEPQDWEQEQRFFRNFLGYIDDCLNAKVEPSIFQLMVFLNDMDVPLAIRVPKVLGGETMGKLISWLLMVVLAFWGRWVLGYQRNYAEYYEEGKSK